MHNNLCARQQGTRKTGDWGPCQCCNEGGNEAACNALYNGQYIYRDRIKYRSVRCEGGNCDPNTKPATTAKCTRANTTECMSSSDSTDLLSCGVNPFVSTKASDKRFCEAQTTIDGCFTDGVHNGARLRCPDSQVTIDGITYYGCIGPWRDLRDNDPPSFAGGVEHIGGGYVRYKSICEWLLPLDDRI